jgi:hypothetical protein
MMKGKWPQQTHLLRQKDVRFSRTNPYIRRLQVINRKSRTAPFEVLPPRSLGLRTFKYFHALSHMVTGIVARAGAQPCVYGERRGGLVERARTIAFNDFFQQEFNTISLIPRTATYISWERVLLRLLKLMFRDVLPSG